MAAVMSKGSLGDSILFGYTRVHSVCFQILINTLSDSSAQILILGALPGADGTECERKDFCLLFICSLDCVSCTSSRVKATGQDQEGESSIIRCGLRVLVSRMV